MISVAIIDDEENNRLMIRNIIKSKFPLISILVEEGEVQPAIEKINFEKPDLVLLDIKLVKGTGFDVVNGLQYEPKVIFTTAYSEFALQAIKVNAFDYLLKPIDDNELIECVKKVEKVKVAEKTHTGRNTEIGVAFFQYSTTAGRMSIRKSDILFFESSGAYTYIVTESQRIMISRGLGDLEEELKESIFFRTHKSFLVNITKIKNIDIKRGGYITLNNEYVIPLSQRKVKEFTRLMGWDKE